MKALYDLPAPAKLNLFLHVVGRREDGYHLLQSAFMLIDWCDTLHVELRRDGQLSREDLTTPLPADDLVLRAARALLPLATPGSGAHIGIAKHIPSQAGMGGGSSDAAACLLALNRLWGLGLPQGALERIGLSLGADVPFFLRGRNAWVEGVGEHISPIDLPSARFVVLKPSAGLETGLIFQAAELQRSTRPAILSDFVANDAASLFGFGHNDLQPVAERLCPAVSQAIEWLAHRGLAARMTGSGTAVFAPTDREDSALRDADLNHPPAGWQIRQCSNLAAHPLEAWAG